MVSTLEFSRYCGGLRYAINKMHTAALKYLYFEIKRDLVDIFDQYEFTFDTVRAGDH